MLQLKASCSLSWLLPPTASRRSVEGGSAGRTRFDLPDRLALIVIGAVAVAATVGTFWILSSSVDLYYPADMGEYVADARGLLGTGVREVRHAPLFPTLVAILLGPLGPVASPQLSLGIAMFLLPVSLFLLLRQWLPNVPSLVGAPIGAFTPMIADLVGWGGGATLLGLDMMVLTIATMEAWLREGGKKGFVVGAFAGLTVASHPFTAAVMVLVIAVRYSLHALTTRRVSADWSALGVRGILSFFALAVPLFLTSAGYYLSLRGSSPVVSWDFGRAAQVLGWGLRGDLAILFFLLLAVALAVPVGKPVVASIVFPITAFVVLTPALLSWDITYNLRVVYFLPLLASVGVALLLHLVLETIEDRKPPAAWMAVGVGVLIVVAPFAAVYGFGYTDWVTVDSAYYQRIHQADLPAFGYLATGEGTVATSWSRGSYDEGKVNGWYVEGLSNRPAIGPGAPWTWTLANVGESELDLQRFFSGEAGIEDGAIQASVSTTGHLADPAIQLSMGGFYYPLAYLNSLSNTYPVPVAPGVAPVLAGNTITFAQPSASTNSSILERVELDQGRLLITYSLVGSGPGVGDWEIWIWPAYYVSWLITGESSTSLTSTVGYRTGSARITYLTSDAGATVTYYESHPVWGIQAIAVRRSQAPSVTLEIQVGGTDPAGAVRQYGERDIVSRFSITTILLWTNTGWMFRFDNETCYQRAYETPNLVIYSVATACRG